MEEYVSIAIQGSVFKIRADNQRLGKIANKLPEYQEYLLESFGRI
jgi:hypothetical protein